MPTLHCLELIDSKYYFNLAKVFVLKLFKMAGKIWVLQAGTEIKLLITDKCKPCEIYRKMNVFNEDEYLSKKNVYKWAKFRALVEKTVHRVERHWLSSKKKVPVAVVCKESHADLWKNSLHLLNDLRIYHIYCNINLLIIYLSIYLSHYVHIYINLSFCSYIYPLDIIQIPIKRSSHAVVGKANSNSSRAITFTFKLISLGKVWTPYLPTTYGLNNSTTVLLQAWLWHEDWYATK